MADPQEGLDEREMDKEKKDAEDRPMVHQGQAERVSREEEKIGGPKVGRSAQGPTQHETHGPKDGAKASRGHLPAVDVKHGVSHEEKEGIIEKKPFPLVVGEGMGLQVEESCQGHTFPKKKPQERPWLTLSLAHSSPL